MGPLLDDYPRRALVVAPHADDEVLGAGGLIARLARNGWDVRVLYVTVAGYRSIARGDTSGDTDRRAEVEAAVAALGVTSYGVLEGAAEHLRLDKLPQAELIGYVEREIERQRPTVFLMPCRGHYHQDHRAVADACVAALRPMPGPPFVPLVLAYGHTGAGWGGHAFTPTVFVDVTDTMEAKVEALRCYATQMCPPPHPRHPDSIRAWNAHFGAMAGVAYAEPYECLRFAVR